MFLRCSLGCTASNKTCLDTPEHTRALKTPSLGQAEPLLQHASINQEDGPVKEAAKRAYRALGIMQNRSTGGKGPIWGYG